MCGDFERILIPRNIFTDDESRQIAPLQGNKVCGSQGEDALTDSFQLLCGRGCMEIDTKRGEGAGANIGLDHDAAREWRSLCQGRSTQCHKI